MCVTCASPSTRVSPLVTVVLPAPESPTTPTTTARAKSGSEPLVAAAVEEQRRAGALAGVLHAAEEQGVIPSAVRALHARDEMRERTLDQGGLADEVEARGGAVFAGAAGETVGKRGLCLAEHAHPVVAALVQEATHLGAPVDRDQDERRLE